MSGELMSARRVHEKYPQISLRDLKRDLKAGKAPYIPVGKGAERPHRRMTDELVQEYLRSKQVHPAPAAPAPLDPIDQAKAATRLRARRRTGHRPH